MNTYAVPLMYVCALVVTVSAGLILSGYAPRPGDGPLLATFVAGAVFGVVGSAVWRLR